MTDAEPDTRMRDAKFATADPTTERRSRCRQSRAATVLMVVASPYQRRPVDVGATSVSTSPTSRGRSANGTWEPT